MAAHEDKLEISAGFGRKPSLAQPHFRLANSYQKFPCAVSIREPRSKRLGERWLSLVGDQVALPQLYLVVGVHTLIRSRSGTKKWEASVVTDNEPCRLQRTLTVLIKRNRGYARPNDTLLFKTSLDREPSKLRPSHQTPVNECIHTIINYRVGTLSVLHALKRIY